MPNKHTNEINMLYGIVSIRTQPYLDENGNLQWETVTNNNGVITKNRPVRIIYNETHERRD